MLREAIMRRCVKRKRVPCSVCKGDKVIKSEKRMKLFNQPGLVMPERKSLFLSFRSQIDGRRVRLFPAPILPRTTLQRICSPRRERCESYASK